MSRFGRRRLRYRLMSNAVVIASLLAVTSCGSLPPLPESMEFGATPTFPTPTQAPTTDSPDGFRTTERVAVRVRNVGCQNFGVGSGFAVSTNRLVTNRHVVTGSSTLQVSTYDGQDLLVDAVTTTTVLADLAVVETSSELPAAVTFAEEDPQVGDEVEIVGYPGGGRLTSSVGKVLGYEEDPLDVNAGEIIRTSAPAEPGSSGSPMYNTDGQLVGVVYGAGGGQSLAIPVSALRELLDEANFAENVPSCE